MAGLDLSRESEEWFAYMRAKGLDRAAARAVEAASREALAQGEVRTVNWEESPEDFRARLVARYPSLAPHAVIAAKRSKLPAYQTAAKRLMAAERGESRKPPTPRKRAASAKVAPDGLDVCALRTEVRVAREALAVANARISQLEAEVANEGRPDELGARIAELEAQVAGYLRWGVAG